MFYIFDKDHQCPESLHLLISIREASTITNIQKVKKIIQIT